MRLNWITHWHWFAQMISYHTLMKKLTTLLPPPLCFVWHLSRNWWVYLTRLPSLSGALLVRPVFPQLRPATSAWRLIGAASCTPVIALQQSEREDYKSQAPDSAQGAPVSLCVCARVPLVCCIAFKHLCSKALPLYLWKYPSTRARY